MAEDPARIPILLTTGAFLVFLGILVAYLIKRMRETGLKNLIYLISSYFIQMASLILPLFDFIGKSHIIPNVLRAAWPLPLVFFVKETFYKNKKSKFIIILIPSLIFFFLNFLLKLTREIAGDMDLLWFLNFCCLLIIVALDFGWLSYASYTDYKILSHRREIDNWVKNRYKKLSWLSILPIIAVIPPVFMTVEASYSWLGPIMIIPIALAEGIFSVGSLYIWFIPKNKRQSRDTGQYNIISPDGSSHVLDTNKLTKRDLFNIIEFLGEKMADLIGKQSSACKGLLFISFDREIGDRGFYIANMKLCIEIISTSVRKELENLNISQADTVIEQLIQSLIDNQSLFTLAGV